MSSVGLFYNCQMFRKSVTWIDNSCFVFYMRTESLLVKQSDDGTVPPAPNPYRFEIETFEYTEGQLQPAQQPQVCFRFIAFPLYYNHSKYLCMCTSKLPAPPYDNVSVPHRASEFLLCENLYMCESIYKCYISNVTKTARANL